MEATLAQAKAYLLGLQDSLKLLPPDGKGYAEPELREGTDLSKAREILKAEGKPMHLDILLQRMGKEVNRNTKGGLGGSLGAYVKKGVVFTRPAPNTFGLVEFEPKASTSEPPDDFGLVVDLPADGPSP